MLYRFYKCTKFIRLNHYYTIIALTCVVASQTANAMDIPGLEFCRTLVRNIRIEKEGRKKGRTAAQIDLDSFVAELILHESFHPKKAIRLKLYEIIITSSNPNIYYDYFKNLHTEYQELVALEWDKLPEENKRKYLLEIKQLTDWVEKIQPLHHDVADRVANDYVELDGAQVTRDAYGQALQLQRKLSEQGVAVKLIPSIKHTSVKNGVHLSILSIGGVGKKSGRLPRKKVLKSTDFNSFLAEAKANGGDVFIDPSLETNPDTGAYHVYSFWEATGKIASWGIGIQQDTNWSEFVHEWRHNIDYVRQQAAYTHSLFGSDLGASNMDRSILSAAMNRTARDIEKVSLSEVNATGAELENMQDQRSFIDPLELYFTLRYRSYHQFNVGLSRVALRPGNITGYLHLGEATIMYATLLTGHLEAVYVAGCGLVYLFFTHAQ